MTRCLQHKGSSWTCDDCDMQRMTVGEEISMADVPLEELRDILQLLLEHHKLVLFRKENHYDGNDYTVVPKEGT